VYTNLDDLSEFPILACTGPGEGPGMDPALHPCNARTMKHMADCGTTINWAFCQGEDPRRVLDLAEAAGVLVIGRFNGLHAWTAQRSDGSHEPIDEAAAVAMIKRVKGHPALLGYEVDDEPTAARYDNNEALFRIVRQHDPKAYLYHNHWAPGISFHGFHSYEELLDEYMERCRPAHVSADLYPVQVVAEDDWLAHRATRPWYCPRHRAMISPHYFEMLEILRQQARIHRVPMLAWTLAQPVYDAATADGEMRFQLFTGLAYGARGIMYFSYYQNHMMADTEGEPTANWHVARQINREMKNLGQVLRKLRHIGVYHHPANLPMTRLLDQYLLGHANDLCSRGGDPIVVGQFLGQGDDDHEYALIVNRSPFEPARFDFHFGTDGDVEAFEPLQNAWRRPWPYNPRAMPATLRPGDGCLYRFRRDVGSKP
jgi:hypothetical protein